MSWFVVKYSCKPDFEDIIKSLNLPIKPEQLVVSGDEILVFFKSEVPVALGEGIPLPVKAAGDTIRAYLKEHRIIERRKASQEEIKKYELGVKPEH